MEIGMLTRAGAGTDEARAWRWSGGSQGTIWQVDCRQCMLGEGKTFGRTPAWDTTDPGKQ